MLAVPSYLYHSLGGSVYASYRFGIPSFKERNANGFDLGISGSYELRYNHFLFETGFGLGYTGVSCKIHDNASTISPMFDSEGDIADVSIYWHKYDSYISSFNANIPLLFGGLWHPFFFKFGPIVGYDIYSVSSLQSIYSVYAKYPFYNTELSNMPQHGFVNHETYVGKSTLDHNLSLRAHLEFGLCLKSSDYNIASYRLSIFAESDLLKMSRSESNLLPDVSGYANQQIEPFAVAIPSLCQASIRSILPALYNQNISIGVRFTFLFTVSSKYTSHDCKCMLW